MTAIMVRTCVRARAARLAWAALGGLLAAGCARAGGAVPGGAAPAGALAYRVPGVNPVSYAVAETVRVEMPMGAVVIARSGAAELSFGRAGGDSVRVTGRFTEFSGSFENPMGGAVRADAGAIRGEFVARLDARGRLAFERVPELDASARQVAGSVEELVRSLFVMLPGRPVARGASWVDTLRVRETADQVTTTATRVVTTTWAGDSAVGGRTLRVLRSRSTHELEVAGSAQGMEVRQRLSGTGSGTALWDAERGVLVEQVSEAELRGSLDVPAAGMTELPITARSRARVALRR